MVGWNRGPACGSLLSSLNHICRRAASHQARLSGGPLRVLFCGSDEFSIASLDALHHESCRPESDILSIDVVTRPDKRTGRGLKTVTAPPLKHAALELGLPLHQIDTFTGWSPPTYDHTANPGISLIVAVSFGLLVPPRILNGAKYGGLNVHPSMLPDMRGPAPIQWTIMKGRTTTGITVQTLHPSKFDHGAILLQSAQPGIQIPAPDTITYTGLRDMLAPIGAEMLVRAVRDRLYIPPLAPVKVSLGGVEEGLVPAPKISPEMTAVDFCNMSWEEISRRYRGLGRVLHSFVRGGLEDTRKIRIKLGAGIRIAEGNELPEHVMQHLLAIPNGVPYALMDDDKIAFEQDSPLYVNVNMKPGSSRRGQVVLPVITPEAVETGPAAKIAAKAKLFAAPKSVPGKKLYIFTHPLICGSTTAPP